MTVLKLNGERVYCPSCVEEMKTRQYVRMIKEWDHDKDVADRDYFQLLNIISDGKFTGFDRTSENEVTLFNAVGWVVTQSFEFSDKLPKVLQLGKKIIDIPKDPSELSIGQNIHLRRDYIDKSKYLAENISIAIAIYLQPAIDKTKFNLERAKEIAKEIDELPIHITYPIGFFLLRRAMRFGQKPEKIWRRTLRSLSTILNKTFPGLPKSTGSTPTMIFP